MGTQIKMRSVFALLVVLFAIDCIQSDAAPVADSVVPEQQLDQEGSPWGRGGLPSFAPPPGTHTWGGGMLGGGKSYGGNTPICTADDDCDDGKACNSGRCEKTCSADHDCNHCFKCDKVCLPDLSHGSNGRDAQAWFFQCSKG